MWSRSLIILLCTVNMGVSQMTCNNENVINGYDNNFLLETAVFRDTGPSLLNGHHADVEVYPVPATIFHVWKNFQDLDVAGNVSYATLVPCSRTDLTTNLQSQTNVPLRTCMCFEEENPYADPSIRLCDASPRWSRQVLDRNRIDNIAYITDTELSPDFMNIALTVHSCNATRPWATNPRYQMLTLVIDCDVERNGMLNEMTDGMVLMNPLINIIALSPLPFDIQDSLVSSNLEIIVEPLYAPCEIYTSLPSENEYMQGDIECKDTEASVTTWKPTPNNTYVSTTMPPLDVQVSRTFSGFGQRKLSIGTLVAPPYVTRLTTRDGTEYGGYCMEFLALFAKVLNISYEIVDLGRAWGYIDQNGEWQGSIRYVMDGVVDVVVAPLTITAEREEVVDFSYAFWDERIGMMTATLPVDQFYLFKPLESTVWLCYFCATFLASASVYLTVWKLKLQDDSSVRFYECAWYSFHISTNQGGDEVVGSRASRPTIASLWMIVFIVLASYSATLMSHLTVTRTELPFSTLEDVVAADDYLLQISISSNIRTLLMQAEDDVFAQAWEKIMSNPEEQMGNPRAFSVDLIEDETIRAVVMADYTQLWMYGKGTGLCNWGMLGDTFLPSGYGVVFMQGSPFKDAIDKAILRLHESGILQHLRATMLESMESIQCEGSVHVGASSVQLDQVWPVFLVLATGILGAGLTLRIETVLAPAQKVEFKY